jgi:hypothetical protein
VAKQIETEKVILISSAKTRCEIPFYYRIAGYLSLHKLLPVFLLKSVNFFTFWLFGTHTKAEEILLKNIINDTDPTFLKWAIHKIMTWKNQTQLVNLKHIHGTADRILPLRFVKADQEIQEGGHLMVLNHREEIDNFFKKEII